MPPHTHYELAAQALEAGKHAFIAKPLAPYEVVDDLAERVTQRERILMWLYTFVYSPPVRAVKRILEAGTVGEIYFKLQLLEPRHLGLHQRDVSVILDLAPRALL